MTSQLQTSEELTKAIEAITSADEIDVPPNVVVSQSFDSTFVRPQHALDALAKPDSLVAFEYQDSRMWVASKFVDTPNGAFVLVVFGNWNQGRVLLNGAYRLYGDQPEVEQLAKTASTAFREFLLRFAIPYKWDDLRVYFLPVLSTPMPGVTDARQIMEALIELFELPGGTAWTLSGDVRLKDGQLDIAWPFVIDTGGYERDMKSRRR